MAAHPRAGVSSEQLTEFATLLLQQSLEYTAMARKLLAMALARPHTAEEEAAVRRRQAALACLRRRWERAVRCADLGNDHIVNDPAHENSEEVTFAVSLMPLAMMDMRLPSSRRALQAWVPE